MSLLLARQVAEGYTHPMTSPPKKSSVTLVEGFSGFSQVLHDHRIALHHATNLLDFRHYLDLRAIPSRKVLAAEGRRHTRFFSDAKDVALGIWDHTFANLVDSGNFFWTGTSAKSPPNAYGPISFVLNAKVWKHLGPFTVRDYSAVSKNSSEVKLADFKEKLKPYVASNGKTAYSVDATDGKTYEIDVAVETIPLSPTYLAYILVDPMKINGASLVDHVTKLVQGPDWAGWSRKPAVRERKCTNDTAQEIMAHLLRWAESLQGRLLHTTEHLSETVPPELKEWLSGLGKRNRALASWLTYIYNGTLLHFPKP